MGAYSLNDKVKLIGGIPLTEVDTICCGRGYGRLSSNLGPAGSTVFDRKSMPRLSLSVAVA
jgi:hypothetical protein